MAKFTLGYVVDNLEIVKIDPLSPQKVDRLLSNHFQWLTRLSWNGVFERLRLSEESMQFSAYA